MKNFFLIVCFLFVQVVFAQELNYTIKNLNSNSKYQDFGTAIYNDSIVVFSSTRERKTISKRTWYGNKQPFLKLYKATIESNGDINNVEEFLQELNSKFHTANATFTNDSKTIYFTGNNFLNKKFKKDTSGWNLNQLYKVDISEDGEVGIIKPMPFNSDNYQTGHPVLNTDNSKLYFISDMPGTLGKTDIFVVDIHEDGSYGEPVNLGPEVNTARNEMFPFLDENDILYFSSDGYKENRGGLDIYANQLIESEIVNASIHIGSPLNSEKDDFGIVFLKNKRSGYFSSNREGGKGDDDMYYFQELNPLVFECLQTITGIVKDSKTNGVLANTSIEIKDNNQIKIESVVTSANGEFSTQLKCDDTYEIVASKIGYSVVVETIELGKEENQAQEIILNLDAEFFDSEEMLIQLNPVYFEIDESIIRPATVVELEKVKKLMAKYPALKVDIRSYTDSRAPDKYNLNLSEDRVKAILEWLIEKGGDTYRLSGKGYGETRLLNKCKNDVKCTDKEHEINVRTEFVIVNSEVIK